MEKFGKLNLQNAEILGKKEMKDVSGGAVGCGAVGDRCSQAGDCCSGYCGGGYCRATPGTCVVPDFGGYVPCSDDAYCQYFYGPKAVCI